MLCGVTLSVRVWIEIQAVSFRVLLFVVTLSVRVWIEIPPKQLKNHRF